MVVWFLVLHIAGVFLAFESPSSIPQLFWTLVSVLFPLKLSAHNESPADLKNVFLRKKNIWNCYMVNPSFKRTLVSCCFYKVYALAYSYVTSWKSRTWYKMRTAQSCISHFFFIPFVSVNSIKPFQSTLFFFLRITTRYSIKTWRRSRYSSISTLRGTAKVWHDFSTNQTDENNILICREFEASACQSLHMRQQCKQHNGSIKSLGK